MSYTIDFSVDEDGSLVVYDSVQLKDSLSGYGIKKTNGTVIVIAGTAMTQTSPGVYEYTFEPEVGSYLYAIEFIKDSVASYRYDSFSIGGGGEEEPETETKAIQFCAVKDNALVTFAAAPVLQSPAQTYGVRRISDNYTVLPSGTALIPLGNGIYHKTFTEAQDSTEQYKFYVLAVIDDIAYSIQASTAKVNSSMLAIGRYTDTIKIAERFGVDNLHHWLCSTSDREEEPIDYAMRAYKFIEKAEAELDDKLSGAFVTAPYTGEIPAIITRVATLLAGIAMYEWRGIDDVNPETNEPQHRLRTEKRDAEKTIKRIAMGMHTSARQATPGMTMLAGADEVEYVNAEE